MVRQRIKGCVIVFMLFGVFIGNCFAAGGSKTLSLSQALSRVDLFSELTEVERDFLKEVGPALVSAGRRVTLYVSNSNRALSVPARRPL